MDSAIRAQLERLQQQCQALQAKNSQLQAALDDQQTLASQWIAQRTRELEQESHEQKKAETLQRVFYRIAERAAAGLPFYDFLKSVHTLLGELLYAKNFYICLCNHKKNTVDFPYYVDERDGDTMQRNDVPHRRGMTEFVLRTETPQLIDATRFKQLQDSGEITEATGDLTFISWLGVPMQIDGRTGGAMVVQGYMDGVGYSEADADVLGFVANHVSAAIERYRAIEEVRNSEERYRSVIENVGVGVVVVQDGMMVFVNPSMERIVGHSREFLLSHPFTASIHPDDVPVVAERHQRRLRGEPVENMYGFRVIADNGEVRTLELSAVVIQWDQREATLLFVMDATTRLQAENTQRVALQKQIELNDIKTRFISMASHEFRTPLAAIHGSVELLMHYNDRLPPAKKLQALEKIDDAVDRMTHMLENVLLIGRTDAGQMQFRPTPLAITPFCMMLVDELRATMADQFQRVQLHVDLPLSDQYFLLDEPLMRNIVGNLLSNAVKYSPQGGRVDIAVHDGGDSITLVVRDQGIGIPQGDQAKLFQSFHRASNVGSIAGTGLGLSIVKEAVLCHKGSIQVQSNVDEGSQFTVMLPTSKVLA